VTPIGKVYDAVLQKGKIARPKGDAAPAEVSAVAENALMCSL
jgi:hypothetical protein